MDFKKLGQQVGKIKKQAEDKLGDRAEPDNLKRDGKELRNILSGDGSLAEKAKEAKAKVIDRDEAADKPAAAQKAAKPAADEPVKAPKPAAAESPVADPDAPAAKPSGTPENPAS